MPSLREAVKLNTFKNTRVNFQYVGVFHLSLCIYVAIRSFHFKVQFVRHIYIPKSARIALLVQVANILYTCASNTQEKQIFDIRIFVRNGKERKSISLAFRFI